jgi:hypothetical protein
VRKSVICVALAASALGGCGSPTSPHTEPMVQNAPGAFQFVTFGMTNVSQTFDYDWQSKGSQIDVDSSGGAITSDPSSATLILIDAGGQQVYSRSLVQHTSYDFNGAPGAWKIRVVLTRASGAIFFTVVGFDSVEVPVHVTP